MPGLKAFDDDVGVGRELEEQRSALRLFQVERDAALVGVQREERGAPVGVRLATDERRLVARFVAASRAVPP